MEEQTFIMYKDVDWSTLNYGFNIPVEMQPILFSSMGKSLSPGESVPIKIVIGDKICEAKLSNSAFSREKFYNHPTEIVRILYSENSDLAQAFRTIYQSTFNYIRERKMNLKPKLQVQVPIDIREKFALYSTPVPNCFALECFTISDNVSNLKEIVSEEVFEINGEKWVDPNASIDIRERIVKIRRIDRSICDNLKHLYDYRCQITGEYVGTEYGGHVIEAHHIDYFVKSQNNDASNIIILSPDFHRIIHKFKPEFDRKLLAFVFPNGVKEKVKLNKHL